ncbi:hypothetical protein [Pedobacter sp. ASV28]|uniref:DUF6965 family protein n=1 Tax=Pedobacter sp. ASV28 TaxID=2795123 RepID=UPI0018ED29B1|nr:hypothetical protein [Pedobacter sp. ASV28]
MSIEELEDYFRTVELPKQPIQLNPSHIISDLQLFLDSHFAGLKGQPINHLTRPLYDRLVELKNYLEMQKEGA